MRQSIGKPTQAKRYEEKQSIKKTHFYLLSLLFVDRGPAKERRTKFTMHLRLNLRRRRKAYSSFTRQTIVLKQKIAVFFQLRRLYRRLVLAC